MKIYNLIVCILIILLKTGNVLSDENIFNVNNIELSKNLDISNEQLAHRAIKLAFTELKKKILLTEDIKKLSDLQAKEIRELVLYYQIITSENNDQNSNKITFNIFFDKEKIYDLFYKRNILYSEISDKELYILPVFKKNEKILIYNQNFFYNHWNRIYQNEEIEFILPLENIESIQKINLFKDNLLDLNLNDLFQEYEDKNLALVLIEDTGSNKEKIFIKSKILNKNIDKNLIVEKSNLDEKNFYKKIINQISEEIVLIVKSQNLIDVKIPSFLNTKLILNNKNNLSDLNERLKKIGLIDNVYIQEFNKKFVILKIKYHGKLSKIIKQLEKQQIILEQISDQWSLKII